MGKQEWDNLQRPKEYLVCDNCQPHFNENKISLHFFLLSFTIFPFLIFSYSLHPRTTRLNKEKRCTKWNNAYASTICMHVRCWLKSRPQNSPSLNVVCNECIAESAGNTSPHQPQHHIYFCMSSFFRNLRHRSSIALQRQLLQFIQAEFKCNFQSAVRIRRISKRSQKRKNFDLYLQYP